VPKILNAEDAESAEQFKSSRFLSDPSALSGSKLTLQFPVGREHLFVNFVFSVVFSVDR